MMFRAMAQFSREQSTGLMARIANTKQVFREPRNGTETDALLTAYAECIQTRKQGAHV